jgi:hypothetical protein
MSEATDADLIWGATAIRKALGLSSNNQVYGLVRSGDLDGVVIKVGKGKRKRLCASRRAIAERFKFSVRADKN